jgi:hypothetical protein
MVLRVLMLASAALLGAAAPSAQSDLDAFMATVVERRDENWKKLQQYILDERATFQLLGPGGARLYGFRRDYTWFIRQGYFVRSPLAVDGATVGDVDRVKYENQWIARERRREERRAKREGAAEPPPETMEDVLRQSIEPQFVSAAYFLRFTFDPGRYALAGRETLDGREVLRIEYYPTRLFTGDDDDRREDRRRSRDADRARDAEVEARLNAQMNKVSLVTLWIDPATHQILRYTFDNVDMDFLPGRWLVRVDDLRASMRVTEAFPDVWLPDTIDMRFRFTTAAGTLEARYDVRYHDYRLADVKTRIIP